MIYLEGGEKSYSVDGFTIQDGEIDDSFLDKIGVPRMLLQFQDGFRGVVRNHVPTVRHRMKQLHKWPFYVSREEALHSHQLLQREVGQSSLTRSNFEYIYGFRFIRIGTSVPIDHELNNHICITLR